MSLEKYKKQVGLLLDVLPYVSQEECFALKGGTAINLFVRNMPRLSVDIDLTYMGDESRDEALELTAAALHRIKAKIESNFAGAKVFTSKKVTQDDDAKLLIERKGVQVKIEANPVIRGTLYTPILSSLQPAVTEEFDVELETKVVDIADLYGGKIAAALDRQHPRDLFDVSLLLANEGITRKIMNGFLCYLVSHKRPIHEVLNPKFKNQQNTLETEFTGMTTTAYTISNFEETRSEMVTTIHENLSQKDKDFLISFAAGNPEWGLFPEAKIQSLPAVKWKLENIKKMPKEKRLKAESDLQKAIANRKSANFKE